MTKSCMAKVCLATDVESYCDKLEERIAELETALKNEQGLNQDASIFNQEHYEYTRQLEADKMELIETLKEVVDASENGGRSYRGRDARIKAKQLLARMEDKG